MVQNRKTQVRGGLRQAVRLDPLHALEVGTQVLRRTDLVAPAVHVGRGAAAHPVHRVRHLVKVHALAPGFQILTPKIMQN